MHGTELSGPALELPDLSDPSPWLPVAAGLATLRIAAVDGPNKSRALCLDYDFGVGAGFVVARREAVVEMPSAWEVRFLVRTTGPPNTFEIKLVDLTGASVWRWTRPSFDVSKEWTEIRVPSRDFLFAWGPAGGGSIACTSAIELAVVASPGGSGSVDIAGFQIFDRSPGRASTIHSSSEMDGCPPSAALDNDDESCWRSAPGAGPHELTIDFGEIRDIGGVVITWLAGAMPHAYRLDVAGAGAAWTAVYDSPVRVSQKSFVSLSLLGVRSLRLVATAAEPWRGVGVRRFDVRPVEWSRTPVEFLTNVALGRRRGAWPRYLLREQTYWTPVASPTSGPVGLIDDDGGVEVGEGGFLVEPSLLVANGSGGDASAPGAPGDSAPSRWITWADADHSVSLVEAPLPVASVRWEPVVADRCGDVATAASTHVRPCDVTLEVAAVAEDSADEDVILVRYRLAAAPSEGAHVSLLVAVRPLQVTPPWQSFRTFGGPSPITRIRWEREQILVGDTGTVTPLGGCLGFGAASFEEGGLAEELSRGVLPTRSKVEDGAGRAEAVLEFDVELAAGEVAERYVECRRRRTRARAGDEATPASGETAPASDRAGDALAAPAPAERFEAAMVAWRGSLDMPQVRGTAGLIGIWDSATTAIAHILACRDGAALQPGPRRYTRSWIRDGAIMSAALLQTVGHEEADRFIRWYAPHQREDGFVPCCVDRDGIDPLVEHDSHGQLVFTVAEIHRFTRDDAIVRDLWPQCRKAAEYIEAIRATRCTPAFETGALAATYGLVPESVSHEGYLAQPVHAYWDDFWAMRGLRDAAYLARELGLDDEVARWSTAADELASYLASSIRRVMQERKLDTVPASVEWADFDPTATAGAISLVGGIDLFPAEALDRTFDEYMKGVRARFHGTLAWNSYSPYEIRIVGALVRLGRREEAHELMQAMLADRRPTAWRQWPEIVWRDIKSPAHIGDLPHCWIGAEFVLVMRSMFVYERERDGALVIGAGVRREWIEGAPLVLEGLPTWYGRLDLSIAQQSDGTWRVDVRGAKPPGGFVVELPAGCTAILVRE